MQIVKAFNHLIRNWDKQDPRFIKKYKTYKSRYLNNSGKQVKKVSEKKMMEMLKAAKYKVIIEIKPPK